MRIAQVAPLYESVPPKLYGGTERVVSFLTEELVRRGHDVTLFASGCSVTAARLISSCPQSLRLRKEVIDPLPHHMIMLEQVFSMANQFDIVHFHTDYLHFPLCRHHKIPQVTTLHGRLDIKDLHGLYREFRDMPLVSISDYQRTPLSWANWYGTVHHGLPEDLFTFHEKPGEYLAFLGRMSPEKQVDHAIEIARRAGAPLKIAAKVDNTDREYFERNIKHLLDDPIVEFIGEIGDAEKDDFLGNALAVLFPINWPEPFGLVMIESMACGTPVISYRCGSVPEVLEDGVTGFIVDGIEEAVEAVRRAPSLSRKRIRRVFEERFSVSRMAEEYLGIYSRVAGHRERFVRKAEKVKGRRQSAVADTVAESGDDIEGAKKVGNSSGI